MSISRWSVSVCVGVWVLWRVCLCANLRWSTVAFANSICLTFGWLCLKLNEMLHKSNQNKCDTFSPLVFWWYIERASRDEMRYGEPWHSYFAILNTTQGHPNIVSSSQHSSVIHILYTDSLLSLSLGLSSSLFRINLCVEKWIYIQWCCQQVNNDVNDNNSRHSNSSDSNNNNKYTAEKNGYTKSTISFLFHFSLWIIAPYKIMDIYAAIIFYHQREIQLLKWKKSECVCVWEGDKVGWDAWTGIVTDKQTEKERERKK